jgi:uridine kinase
MSPAFTIGISGGSGSGKTFFIRKLASYFKPTDICLLSQDHYYFPKETQKLDANGIENFDLPESIDHDLFIDHLKCLKNGKRVSKQEYTFNKASAIPDTITLVPARILLVEGLFILVNSEVEKELDLKIFLEAKDHIKLSRRISRDKIERGYDVDDVLYRFENHVMPVYETLIEPQKHKADFIIPNHKSFDKALDILVSALKEKLKG